MDYVSRTEARRFRCTYCQAEPGDRCMGKRGFREASHMERVNAALSARPGRRKTP